MKRFDVGIVDDENKGIIESLNSFIKRTEIKRLINQILTAQASRNFRSLAILSEYPKEGKTFFTAALALAYARFLPGRVLVVNTVPQSKSGNTLLKSIIGIHLPVRLNKYELGESCRIDLITARSDLMDRRAISPDFQISSYIDKFADSYDIVFVDTCAMSDLNDDLVDPVIVAQHVDASILITSPKSLDRSSVRRVTGKLHRYGIRPLGAVYNAGVMGGWTSRQ
ncbi:MAG: hypothetical protein ACOX2O_02665 [Bdellovibrionota bacterium]|jgi:hypothetical protein